MTIAEMRALLGLGDEVSDAQVVEAYAAYLGAGVPDGSAVELIPLALVKKHLRVMVDETDDDDLIDGYVTSAIAALDGAEGWLGRAIAERVYVQILDACAGFVRLPYPPIVSVSAIEVQGDGNAWVPLASTDWRLDDRTVVLGTGVLPGLIRATYRAGYNPDANRPLPMSIRQAILLMVGEMFENRSPVVTGATAGRVPLSTTVENLLAPFRVFA